MYLYYDVDPQSKCANLSNPTQTPPESGKYCLWKMDDLGGTEKLALQFNANYSDTSTCSQIQLVESNEFLQFPETIRIEALAKIRTDLLNTHWQGYEENVDITMTVLVQGACYVLTGNKNKVYRISHGQLLPLQNATRYISEIDDVIVLVSDNVAATLKDTTKAQQFAKQLSPDSGDFDLATFNQQVGGLNITSDHASLFLSKNPVNPHKAEVLISITAENVPNLLGRLINSHDQFEKQLEHHFQIINSLVNLPKLTMETTSTENFVELSGNINRIRNLMQQGQLEQAQTQFINELTESFVNNEDLEIYIQTTIRQGIVANPTLKQECISLVSALLERIVLADMQLDESLWNVYSSLEPNTAQLHACKCVLAKQIIDSPYIQTLLFPEVIPETADVIINKLIPNLVRIRIEISSKVNKQQQGLEELLVCLDELNGKISTAVVNYINPVVKSTEKENAIQCFLDFIAVINQLTIKVELGHAEGKPIKKRNRNGFFDGPKTLADCLSVLYELAASLQQNDADIEMLCGEVIKILRLAATKLQGNLPFSNDKLKELNDFFYQVLQSHFSHIQINNKDHSVLANELKKIATALADYIAVLEEARYYNPGPQATEPDGNCGYNAIALAICDFVYLNQFHQENFPDLYSQLTERLGLENPTQDELKIWIEAQENWIAVQQEIAFVLRNIAVTALTKNYGRYQEIYHDFLKGYWDFYKNLRKPAMAKRARLATQLEKAKKRNIKELIEELAKEILKLDGLISSNTFYPFDSHPEIKQKILEFVAREGDEHTVKQELIVWWESVGKQMFFADLKQDSGEPKTWADECTLDALAKTLNVAFAWQQAGAGQMLGIAGGELTNLTDEHQALLENLGVGFKIHGVFCLAVFDCYEDLARCLHPFNAAEVALVTSLLTQAEMTGDFVLPLEIRGYEIQEVQALYTRLKQCNVLIQHSNGDFIFVCDEEDDGTKQLKKTAILSRISGVVANSSLEEKIIVQFYQQQHLQIHASNEGIHWRYIRQQEVSDALIEEVIEPILQKWRPAFNLLMDETTEEDEVTRTKAQRLDDAGHRKYTGNTI